MTHLPNFEGTLAGDDPYPDDFGGRLLAAHERAQYKRGFSHGVIFVVAFQVALIVCAALVMWRH